MQDQVNWDAYKFLTVYDQVLNKKKRSHKGSSSDGLQMNTGSGRSGDRNQLRNSMEEQTPGYRYVMQA